MEYSEKSHITTIREVESFFDHLVFERKVNFHPDDAFADYINVETGEPTFSSVEISIYDRLMNESFEICEKNNVDIYEIGFRKLSEAITR